MISAIFFGALEGQTILDCFHGFVSRLRNLKEDGLKIGDFSFDLPPDWIAFPGIWGIEEPLKSFLGGLRIPEDFWGTRSPGISLETERFIGADFSRNSSYIGLDCFLGFFLEFYYSLFFVHMYLNLTRYGWLCFTEVSSVFFMKQESIIIRTRHDIINIIKILNIINDRMSKFCTKFTINNRMSRLSVAKDY